MAAMTEIPETGQDARGRVLAAVAGATATLRPPALLADRPLRPLPPPLAARPAARTATGPDADGTGRPRRFARDPLRLTRAQRRAAAERRSWESSLAWIGPVAGRRERALVTVATEIVARICATVAWGSPQLAGHRDRLDLGAELDQIDAQAFAMALVPEADARGEQQWLATVDRVAALDSYATQLAALDRRLAALDHADRVNRRIGDLIPGALADRHAGDQLGLLADELTGLSSAVAEITGVLRTGRADES